MFSKLLVENGSFYFIGIGGVSMSALALLLNDMGKSVAGSDPVENEYTERLQKAGVRVDSRNVPPSVAPFDVIVYTDAVKDNHIQLREAFALGKIVVSRGELLKIVSSLYDRVIAVAGCHGKTTCTAMLAHIFNSADEDFTCHIGGNDTRFMNYYSRGNKFFITEACEYNKNFLLLDPDISVVLNSDADHIECYGTPEKLREAYVRFADSAGIAVSLYGDLPISGNITFGFDDRADYFAKGIRNDSGKYSFIAYEGINKLGVVKLDVYGKHHVLNALAAIAVSRTVGFDFGRIARGLSQFKGVQRRFENIGVYHGGAVIADYAHHPNEIKATLRTAKQITKGQLYVVFQPHTYSRTKNFFRQFVAVLSPLKNLLIYKTFAAREYFDDAGSALTLSQSLKKSRYADSVRDIEQFLSGVSQEDTVLILGAGDIYYIVKKFLDAQN